MQRNIGTRSIPGGRIVLESMLVVAIFAGPASAQFGQSRGRNGNTNGNGTNNRQNNQAIGEALIGGMILGAAIDRALQPPRQQYYQPNYQQNYRPNYRQNSQQNYRPNYQQNSQPKYQENYQQSFSSPARPSNSSTVPQDYVPIERVYVESRPVERIISTRPVETPVEKVVYTESVVSLKPNIVKETPRPNDSLRAAIRSLAVEDGSAADPLLAVSTQQAIERVTEAVSAHLETHGAPDARETWKAVVDSRSAALEIDRWWRVHGASIDETDVKALGTPHVELSKLVQNLQDGLLSDAGKKAAIDKIGEHISAIPVTSPVRKDLAGSLSKMRQFQRFGTLLGLAGAVPDPIVPILQGTHAMGIPVSVVAEILDVPLMQHPAADAVPLGAGVTIAIVNPATNAQPVNCAIGGRQVEMKPGSTEPLTASASVLFDPGNGARRSVAVSPGTWAWKTENGLWSLGRVTPRITIDNSKFRGAFHYTCNGKQAVLGAGETTSHSHAMPVEICFDRGNGHGAATKMLTFGTYVVGIDTTSHGVELFRTDVPVVAPSLADGPSAATVSVLAGPKAGTGVDKVRKALADAEKRKELGRLLQSLEHPQP